MCALRMVYITFFMRIVRVTDEVGDRGIDSIFTNLIKDGL
jgi:hypothetical protein